MPETAYKLNYYNPLLYIYALAGFSLIIVISPFLDESLGWALNKNWQDLKNPTIYNPRPTAVYLGIVIKKK